MLRTFRYEEIADELRKQLDSGTFDQAKLPSERTLMAQFEVHRNTVRRALSILRDEGRITPLEKRGSFVNQEADVENNVALNKTRIAGTVLVITHWDDISTALESLLNGLAQALGESLLSPLYFDSRPQKGTSRNLMPSEAYLRANNVRGIVLWPQNPTDLQELRRLRDFAPLVLVDREILGFETHSVLFDDFSGGRAVTDYLLELGHRRIGFLTDEVFAHTVQQRWRGYSRALESRGMFANPTCNGLFQGMFDPPYSAQMRLFLEGAGRPLTAVVCSNDTVAMDFIRFLRREGRRVPEDIAVTGFGNLLPNSMDAMQLTTVRQPFEETGQTVGRILLAQTAPNAPLECGTEYDHIRIPVQLVVRASSGEKR